MAACLFAAACGALPQPFSHEGKVDNPLVAPQARAGIKVRAVAGMPHGAAFAEEIAAAFRRDDIAAQTGAGPSGGYTLMGRAVTRPGPAPSQARVGILWRVLGPNGGAAGLHHQEHLVARADWLAGSRPLLRRLARDAVAGIAPAIADPKRRVSPPLRPVAVRDITGAPGDGRVSLRRSLAFELRKLGFPVTESRESGTDAVVVSGTVKVGRSPEGGDRVEIAWTVADPAGRMLGSVKQANTVEAGSLQRSWGVTAALAARAAAPGIARILRRGMGKSGP
ncbi:MAG: hypothetical protein OEO83_01145 [Alphaproteobacteria bacterium]|nr:hypothetical protein [Alphaproteobacteria bacterium]